VRGDKVREALPRAVLFDLDDTIISNSRVTPAIWVEVCDKLAPQELASDLVTAVQESSQWFWSESTRHRRGRLNPQTASLEIVQTAFDRLGADAPPSLVGEIAETYRARREEAASLFPGAVETLGRLRNAGVRLALITNGSAKGQRRKVERFELAGYFDCIVIEGEFGVGKPDERVYLHALAQLSARPSEAWMVGDNLEWEIAVPQRLGLRGVWVDWAGNGLPESTDVRPDRIVRAISELV
jgi:putative hydrolase of the HAD superfamily